LSDTERAAFITGPMERSRAIVAPSAAYINADGSSW
jgi:hypothetical protein